MVELYVIVRLFIVVGQGVYWFWLREENREEVVWNACVHPGVIVMPSERKMFWCGFWMGFIGGIVAGIVAAAMLLVK